MLVLVVLAVLFGPLISPETYMGANRASAGLRPGHGWRYLLGSDVYGHSILMYVLSGARTTVGVGAAATALALAIAAGFTMALLVTPPWLGWLMGRAVELAWTIPAFALALVLIEMSGHHSPLAIALILGVIGGLVVCRPIASRSILAKKDEACPQAEPRRASHAAAELPSACRAVVTPLLASLILAGATLDFLGMGLQPPNVSWGTAMSLTIAYSSSGEWWWFFIPGLALFATVLAIFVFGETVMQPATANQRVRR